MFGDVTNIKNIPSRGRMPPKAKKKGKKKGKGKVKKDGKEPGKSSVGVRSTAVHVDLAISGCAVQ